MSISCCSKISVAPHCHSPDNVYRTGDVLALARSRHDARRIRPTLFWVGARFSSSAPRWPFPRQWRLAPLDAPQFVGPRQRKPRLPAIHTSCAHQLSTKRTCGLSPNVCITSALAGNSSLVPLPSTQRAWRRCTTNDGSGLSVSSQEIRAQIRSLLLDNEFIAMPSRSGVGSGNPRHGRRSRFRERDRASALNGLFGVRAL